MKEIIETVSTFGPMEWVGIGLVGLFILTALPFLLWRMIIGVPKLLWRSSKFCAIILLGGGALFAGISCMGWFYDNKPRLEELKEIHGEKGGIKAFWDEVERPRLPEEYKIGSGSRAL